MSSENGTVDNKQRLKELTLGSNVSSSISELKVYKESDLKSHNTEKDCWMAIHGLVYDTSNFLDDHPGVYSNQSFHILYLDEIRKLYTSVTMNN